MGVRIVNALEVDTVKARQRYTRVMCALLLGLSASTAGAQRQRQTLRPGQTPGPRFLVPIFHTANGTDKTVGTQVSDVIRERMMDDFAATELVIVPKVDIETSLEQSGYSKSEALTFNDLKQLAPTVHAEEYLDGVVESGGNGTYVVHATLYLVRPEGMAQPLPDVTGAKPGDVAKQLSSEVEKARKQIAPTQACLIDARQGKADEARVQAEKGITAYPNAVLARVCLLELANQTKSGPDSIIRYSEEILKIAPENQRALKLVADAYNEKHEDDKYVSAMMQLLKADPGNASLQDQVVQTLVRLNKPEIAKPIVEEAVKQNPGDPQLIRDEWLVYRQLKDWKRAAAVGEEMIKSDTAMGDTLFYTQLIGAYVADSQLQKAAEAAARGANKHSKNATLWLQYAELSRQIGQLPQSLQAINKVLEINPKYPQATMVKAQIFSEMDQVDSMFATLRSAVAQGDDKQVAGGMALTKANAIFREWSADTAKTIDRGHYVMGLLAAADSMNSTDGSSFLLGATKLIVGQLLLTRAGKERNCDDAKQGNDLVVDAGLLIAKSGRAYPQQAQQMMGNQMQLSTYGAQLVKAVCK